MQVNLFSSEIRTLANNKSLSAQSSILSLSPYLDNDGLLRVGGRISRSLLPFARKHSIAPHPLTEQIVDHAHLRTLHAGVQLTLSVVRQEFWIIRASSLIQQRVHRCVVCARKRAAVITQLMSDLLRARISAPARSLQHSGLDYAGPLQIRASAG